MNLLKLIIADESLTFAAGLWESENIMTFLLITLFMIWLLATHKLEIFHSLTIQRLFLLMDYNQVHDLWVINKAITCNLLAFYTVFLIRKW